MPRTWTLPTLPKTTLEDPNDETLGWTAQHNGGPTNLHVYSPFKYASLAGIPRTSGTTNASATVTDTSAVLANAGYLVSGIGIPAGTYVGVVTVATGYTLVNAIGAAVNATVTNASAALTLTPPAYRWTGGAAIPATAPAAPTMSSSTSGGTLPTATTYTYSYAWLTDKGETLPSATATQLTGAGATNSNTVTVPTWPAYATGFSVYGRVGATQTLLAINTTAALAAGITGATTVAFGAVAWIDTGTTSTTLANVGRAHSGKNEALANITH